MIEESGSPPSLPVNLENQGPENAEIAKQNSENSLCDYTCGGKFISLKILGIASVIVAIFTFGFAAFPYGNVTNVDGTFPTQRINDLHFGSWWAGIPLFIVGLMGAFVNNRIGLIFTATIALMSVCVGIAAVVLDAVGSTQLAAIKACFNNDGTVISGDQAYRSIATSCIEFTNDGGTKNCYCVGSSSTCAVITTRGTDDCDYVVDDYPTDVRNSAILVGLCFFFSLIFLVAVLVSLSYEPNLPFLPVKEEDKPGKEEKRAEIGDLLAEEEKAKDLSWVDGESSIALGHRQGRSAAKSGKEEKGAEIGGVGAIGGATSPPCTVEKADPLAEEEKAKDLSWVDRESSIALGHRQGRRSNEFLPIDVYADKDKDPSASSI